jgi:hypothetical protein
MELNHYMLKSNLKLKNTKLWGQVWSLSAGYKYGQNALGWAGRDVPSCCQPLLLLKLYCCYYSIIPYYGAWGSVMVKALRY